MLSATKVRNETRPGVYTDGPGRYGLAMVVKVGAYGLRRTWAQRVTVSGKRTMIGLGRVEFATLTEARTWAFENARANARREPLPHGGERLKGTTRARAIPTFGAVADEFIKLQATGWRADSRNEANWRASLRHVGGMVDSQVDTVTVDDVIAALTPIWTKQHATAKTVRQRVRKILAYAMSKGWRLDNAADDRVDAALPTVTHQTAHRAALAYGDVPAAYRTIGTVTGTQRGAALALRFLILTGTRRDEARLARWSEIDTKAATWIVPGERTKSGREHRVPLSDAALAVLAEARQLRCAGGLVFCGARSVQVGETALLDLQRKLAIKGSVHGFRSSFRSWCSDTGVVRELAEWSLAHVFQSDTERSYDRSDRLEGRREVMQAWAAHVAGTL